MTNINIVYAFLIAIIQIVLQLGAFIFARKIHKIKTKKGENSHWSAFSYAFILMALRRTTALLLLFNINIFNSALKNFIDKLLLPLMISAILFTAIYLMYKEAKKTAKKNSFEWKIKKFEDEIAKFSLVSKMFENETKNLKKEIEEIEEKTKTAPE